MSDVRIDISNPAFAHELAKPWSVLPRTLAIYAAAACAGGVLFVGLHVYQYATFSGLPDAGLGRPAELQASPPPFVPELATPVKNGPPVLTSQLEQCGRAISEFSVQNKLVMGDLSTGDKPLGSNDYCGILSFDEKYMSKNTILYLPNNDPLDDKKLRGFSISPAQWEKFLQFTLNSAKNKNDSKIFVFSTDKFIQEFNNSANSGK